MTQRQQKAGIFFDLDGTLINTLPDISGNLNQTRKHFGLKLLDSKEIQGNIGKGIEHLIRSCFQDVAIEKHPEILDVMMKFYGEMPYHGGELYKGALETLTNFHSKKSMVVGIVTNKPTIAAVGTVNHYLKDFPFALVWGPEKVSAKKPSPQHLLESIRHCKLDPKDCVYVGDDEVDYLTAKAANVEFYGAGWGFGSVRKTPGKILENIQDLLEFV